MALFMSEQQSRCKAVVRRPAVVRRNLRKNRRISRPIPWLLAVLVCGLLTNTGCGGKPESASEFRMEVRKICERSFPECRVEFRSEGNAEIYDNNDAPVGTVRFNETAQEAARGFRGPVPVCVIFNASGEIVHIEALPNREDTPYMAKLDEAGFWENWNGFRRREASETVVDAVTGATYSSRGAIQSVQQLLK